MVIMYASYGHKKAEVLCWNRLYIYTLTANTHFDLSYNMHRFYKSGKHNLENHAFHLVH